MNSKTGAALATQVKSAPVDAFGRWMEEHGASIELTVMFGTYHATVSWKKLVSFSDSEGEHSIHRHLSRSGQTAQEAIASAMGVAFTLTAKEK